MEDMMSEKNETNKDLKEFKEFKGIFHRIKRTMESMEFQIKTQEDNIKYWARLAREWIEIAEERRQRLNKILELARDREEKNKDKIKE